MLVLILRKNGEFSMNNDQLMLSQLNSLLAGERSPVAILANASALINQTVGQLNGAGFYLYDHANDELVLGPFQGRVACMHIKMGAGVCGTAAQDRNAQVVADVSQYPGYISCDAAAKSELVVPLVRRDGSLYGVLDLDAPVRDRFDKQLVATMTTSAAIIMKAIDEAA